MAVSFDVHSDSRFGDSLQDLTTEQAEAVLFIIYGIQTAGLPWVVFERTYGWEALGLAGSDTYPGGIELYSFIIQLPSGVDMQIFGHKYDDLLVVCSLARMA